MLSFIKKLFGFGPATTPVAEVPYKVEAPAEVVAVAAIEVPVEEAPVAPAKKPRAKKEAGTKATAKKPRAKKAK